MTHNSPLRQWLLNLWTLLLTTVVMAAQFMGLLSFETAVIILLAMISIHTGMRE